MKPQKTDRPRQGARAFLDVRVEKRAIDEGARTVELAFSSESPVERWYGTEILSHEPGACRLERLNDGAALLINHDANQHVGVVERAWVDDDRVGRAVVRFADDEDGERCFKRVREQVLTKVSVGYVIHQIEETQEKGGATTLRMTDWEPLEVSFVAVPADASVGAGRSEAGIPHEDSAMSTGTDAPTRTNDQPAVPEVTRAGEVTQADLDKLEAKMKEEREAEARAKAKTEAEHAEIRTLGERYNMKREADDLIELGGTAADMRAAVKNHIMTRNPEPVPATTPIITGGAPRVDGRLLAFENNREGHERAYITGMWARGFLFGDAAARTWCSERFDTRAMAASVTSKGGVFVPEQMADTIIDLREKYGVARRIADVWPMSSDTMWVPRWTGDVTASFIGENEQYSDSEPAFDGVQLVARKLGALTRIPEELIEDAGAVIMIGDRVTNNMAWAFAKKEDQCLVDGDGTSAYGGIYGLRPKIIDGSHTKSAIDAASGVDTFGEVTATDLNAVRAALPEYAEEGGDGPLWLASKAGKNLTFDRLTQAAGGMTMAMFGEKPQDAYLGDRIVTSQAMPKGAATDYSNVAMLFHGNFRMGVTMGSRREFRAKVLEERYADYDQIGIRASERFDMVVHGLGDTSEAGPIVGLIGE